jgi:hypothetical protein
MRHPDPATFEWHCMPLLDTGYHSFDVHCPCGAYEDAPGSIIHKALDGRDEYERGRRKRH